MERSINNPACISFDWFISIVGQSNWDSRRKKMHKNLARAIHIERGSLGKIEFFKEKRKDLIVYYLYLLDNLIKGHSCFNQFDVARIILIFQSLGNNYKNLIKVTGAKQKVIDIFNRYKNDPFPHLYELLVAVHYQNEGWQAEMMIPCNNRTPDIHVLKENLSFYIECKYLSKDLEYIRREEKEFLKRVELIENNEVHEPIGMCLDIDFKVQINESKEDCLLKAIKFFLKSKDVLYSDGDINVTCKICDYKKLTEHFRNYRVLFPSPQIINLISGNFDEYADYHFFMKGQDSYWDKENNTLWIYGNPGTIIILKYKCSSEKSITKRTKAVTRKIRDAEEQLQGKEPAVIHFGYETTEDIETEKKRIRKIDDSIKNYCENHINANAASIILNALMFCTFPHDEYFDCRETSYFHMNQYKGYECVQLFFNIGNNLLFGSHYEIINGLSHWELDEFRREIDKIGKLK